MAESDSPVISLFRILLVDGDPEDRELFTASVTERFPEATVEAFVDGPELLRALETYPESGLPSGIVLEYKLPTVSGAELLQAIGFHPRFITVPKVVWSNVITGEQVNECLLLGASRFVLKPTTRQEIREFLDLLYALILPTGESPPGSAEAQTAG